MKANEAPKRIWMDLEWIPHFDCKDCITEDSIEYVRKDAFIEKAIKWLIDNIQNYTDNGMGEHSFVLVQDLKEDFKKCMEGE